MKRTLALCLAAAAVIAVAGTVVMTGHDHTTTSPPEVGEVLSVGSSRDIVLPLDRYQHSPDDLTTIDRATAVLARRCVREFGQTWVVPDPLPVPASTGSSRYGVMDYDEVSTSGYHPPDNGQPKSPDLPEPPPEAMMIYTGKGMTSFGGKQIPEGGCLGQARRTVERDVPATIQAADLIELDQSTFVRAQQDDRVQRVMAGWRGCMAESGYSYTDVWAANNDIRWSAQKPSQAEIDTAKSDVLCRQRTKLVDTWFAVETAYQRQAIGERAEQFEALDSGMRIRLENAKSVLETG